MDYKKLVMIIGLPVLGIIIGGQVAFASEYDPNSLVDTLKAKGIDSSKEYRTELAKENGIEGYIGTVEQNITLLNIIKGNQTPVVVTSEQDNGTKLEGKTTTITVTATAYTAYCKGCSGITKTGIDLRANPNTKLIAVDPNVIPLGSRVYVEGYGEAIAGDTGGAIKGAGRIDVFIPDKQEALNWGVRIVKLTILK